MHQDKDTRGNAVSATSSLLESVKDSFVYSCNQGKLLVVKGLENYIVVDTPDALLICPRDETQFRQLFNDIAHNHEEFV